MVKDSIYKNKGKPFFLTRDNQDDYFFKIKFYDINCQSKPVIKKQIFPQKLQSILVKYLIKYNIIWK